MELLIVVTLIGVLAVMVVANWSTVRLWTQRTASLSNIRQIGVAFSLYAGDHDQRLPRRVVSTNTTQKWPKLLADYLDDLHVFAAVGDRNNYIFRHRDPLSDSANNTSYIMNGYNDLGAFTNEAVEVRISGIPKPSQVLLLGTPKSGSTHFYMDMLEGKGGNHVNVLNLNLYGNGSVYLFADGSARFLTEAQYDVRMWLLNPDFEIP